MSYYFLIILLIICITAAVIIIRKDVLKKYKPEMQYAFIFPLPTFPISMILMKLDRDFQPLQNVSFIIKGIIVVFLLTTINTIIYSLIKKKKTK